MLSDAFTHVAIWDDRKNTDASFIRQQLSVSMSNWHNICEIEEVFSIILL